MKDVLGCTPAKQEILQGHAADAAIDLVTETNAFRARGSTTAHDFDPQDILEAVEW